MDNRKTSTMLVPTMLVPAMLRPTMKAVVLLTLAFSIACGGSKSEEGTTPDNAATGENGEVLRSSSGNAISKEAHKDWESGITAFNVAEKQGWNPARCSAVASKFEDANDAQGKKFAEAIYMSGLTAQRCSKEGDARKFYNTALQANPKLCKARVAVGLLDLEKNNRQGAMSNFSRSVRDDPQCTSGYTNLAILQRQQGGSAEAEALKNLRRALAIESDYLPAINQMALLYYERGKRPKQQASLQLAELVCSQAVQIDNKYAPIFNTWGLVKIRSGDVIEALRFFEKAILLDPSMYEAQMNFAEITLSFRGYQDAQRSFAKATELRPKSYDAVVGLGAAFRGLEQFDKAKGEYEKAMKMDSKRPEAYFNLGVLHQDYLTGSVPDLQKAKQFYNQFLSKARGKSQHASAVNEVENKCKEQKKRRGKKRVRRKDCRPGRIQNIDTVISAIREGEAIEREAKAMEAAAAQQGQ